MTADSRRHEGLEVEIPQAGFRSRWIGECNDGEIEPSEDSTDRTRHPKSFENESIETKDKGVGRKIILQPGVLVTNAEYDRFRRIGILRNLDCSPG